MLRLLQKSIIGKKIRHRSTMHINELPPEMLLHIFRFLSSLQDRKILSLVCHKWNNLAFDCLYLKRIRLTWSIEDEGWKRHRKLLRNYRRLHLRCYFRRVTLMVQQFSDRLQTMPMVIEVPIEQFPRLEHLTELDIIGITRLDVPALAPNLRKLYASSSLEDLPAIIQALPLEHLEVSGTGGQMDREDLFSYCRSPTNLKCVIFTHYRPLSQYCLELMIKWCPKLVKLSFNASQIGSLSYLTSLKHLKVLDLRNYHHRLIAARDCVLTGVNVVKLILPDLLQFDRSMRELLPNVRHLILFSFQDLTTSISNGFPRLTALEVSFVSGTRLETLLTGLVQLRELTICHAHLFDTHLPPMKLRRLTLVDSTLEIVTRSGSHFPHLQRLTLLGKSQCITLGRLPPRCVVSYDAQYQYCSRCRS